MKNKLWLIKNFGILWILKYKFGIAKEGVDFITPGLLQEEVKSWD